MKTTMRSAAMAGALAVLLSACGGSPTSSASADPAGPSYDGHTSAAGNQGVPPDTSDTDAHDSSASDTTARGGFTMGSGG
jgi:ABC-type glycerol-3-phosphate transport system substrate-binding protein